MKESKCPICGKPTRIWYGKLRKDGLCGEHADLLKEEKIKECTKCGTWYEAKKACPTCSIEKATNSACIICTQEANGKPLCLNCYHSTQNFIEAYDKNKRIDQIRDHYYNLKDKIFRMRDSETIKENCIRLFAIAKVEETLHNDTSLVSKVYKDISTIIEKEQNKNQSEKTTTNIKETIKEKDKVRAEVIRAEDGHYVESDMEAKIDNVLYNEEILHCYGKNIDQILEARKKCDWFIPIKGTSKGVYIEYWGMDTPKYLKDRKEKEELYKKYNIPYIGIEKDDPKGDTQEFRSRLIRDIKTKALEYYNCMPEWK